MNFIAGYQEPISCQLHPGQNVLKACTDVTCLAYPFLCRVCLQDQATLTQHSSHGNAIKNYEDFLHLISKYLSEQQSLIVNNYKDVFLKPNNASVLKWLGESDQHLSNLEKFVESQKYMIQSDFKQMIDEIQFTLNNTQQHMFERLDEFYKSYRANLISLKEIAEPLNLILTKYKYYANLNNLRTKVGCENIQSRSTHILKIKNCLCVSKFLESADKSQQLASIQRTFIEINKALDSLPQYQNKDFNKTVEDATRLMQSYFITNLVVPDIQIVGSFIPQPSTPAPSSATPVVDISIHSFVVDETLNEAISDRKSEQSFQEESILEDPLPVNESPSPFLKPESTFVSDSRLGSHIIVNQLVQKPSGFKFKIKKKLNLDIYISAICLISKTLLGIGGKEGSIKLLDLTTNKSSFYPNAFITHFDEVICLTALKHAKMSSLSKVAASDKGGRMASAALDTNIIIWTLGENNIPYPERKLVGFDKHIVRMVDLEDGSHLAAANCIGDVFVVNYHDNRVPFTFRAKQPTMVIEIFHMSRLDRFAAISNTGQVQVYSLGFKQMQWFSQASKQSDNSINSTLLMNCEMEYCQQLPSNSKILCCIVADLNDSLVLFCGNATGQVTCFDLKKNEQIAQMQVHNTPVLEMVCFKTMPDNKKQGILVTVLGEGQMGIKGFMLTPDGKTTAIQQCGELMDKVMNSNNKYLVQALEQSGSDGRAAIVTLNASQRGISILELM